MDLVAVALRNRTEDSLVAFDVARHLLFTVRSGVGAAQLGAALFQDKSGIAMTAGVEVDGENPCAAEVRRRGVEIKEASNTNRTTIFRVYL